MSGRAGVLALGFAPAAVPLLRRLQESGIVGEIRWPGDAGQEPAARWLAERWPRAQAVVAVGACGLVTRLIAPLLEDKRRDPAVVVLDPRGRFAIPLLGGHGAGAERLSLELAALLDGRAVLSGDGAAAERLALDAFGRDWGWNRGGGDWNALMAAAAAGRPTPVRQEAGLELWRHLAAARDGMDDAGGGSDATQLVIGPRTGPGCRWHPPCLWLGLGCERDTDRSVLERLVDTTLARAGLAAEAVAGLASVTRKGDEPALLALAAARGWPLRLHPPEALATVSVPNPSAVVQREMGTPSVAEAAALLSADGPLLVRKTIERARPGERGAATLAVAAAPRQWQPSRGALHLVGSGPGRLDLLCPDARRALAGASVWLGYGPYLDRLEPLRRPDQLRLDGRLTEERARCAEALELAVQGVRVALVSSGDSGIYGMAGLALELWLARAAGDRPAFEVHPGLSALQLAAARAGAPLMHDFCAISLSDRLTPWPVIERRLRAAAAGDFVVALYNPRSRQRDWQLGRARELLLAERPPGTPALIARELGRPGETLSLHTLADLPLEAVDMLSLVLVGNSATRAVDGWMVTPRGYAGT